MGDPIYGRGINFRALKLPFIWYKFRAKGSMSLVLKGRTPLGNSGLIIFGAQGRSQLERGREREKERARVRGKESRLVAEQREQRAWYQIATNM